MLETHDVLARLIGLWKGEGSTETEIFWLVFEANCVKTSRMVHRDHFERMGDPSTAPWIDRSGLPWYFDSAKLQEGLDCLIKKETGRCEIPFTHVSGNTDGGFVSTELTNSFFAIVRLGPEEFEIHEGGRIYKLKSKKTEAD